MSDIARRWLSQARRDLSDVDWLVEGERWALSCFVSQQVAEKALKATLLALGADSIRGHGVGDLCRQVGELLPDAEARCGAWRELDTYYVPTRYPDALPSGIPADTFTRRQAQSARELAADALAFADEVLAGSG